MTLREQDARHLRVIRASPGEAIEVVDADGTVFDARVSGRDTATLYARQDRPEALHAEVVLYAGVLVGSRWDDLVDGAVQAGASAIVPLVQSSREQAMVERRLERIERVVEAAAKQSKRLVVPRLGQPVRYADLPRDAAGIVLDEEGGQPLVTLLAQSPPPSPVSLVVGAASGLPRPIVEELVAGGWRRASLGPTVLRSELAAAVAISCVVQSLAASQ